MEPKSTTETPSGESHASSLLHQQLDTYLGVPLSILGVLGNMLVNLVWRRVNRSRDETTRSAGVHMMVLAVVNNVLLISFFVTEVLPQLQHRLNGNLHFVRYYCRLSYPVHHMSVVASVWLMVGLVANRLVAVTHPHRAHIYNSLRVTKVIILAIAVSAVAVSIPYFFNQPLLARKKTGHKVTAPCHYTSVQRLYDLWGRCIVFVAVPWTLVCCGTLLIMRTILFKTRIQKHKKRGKRQTEHRTTITVLLLTSVFLILLLFQFVATCLWKFRFGADDPERWMRVSSTHAVARLGVVFNAAIGFVVYCVGSSAFRKELGRMFGCQLQDYSRFADTIAKSKSRHGIINGGVLVDYDGYPEEVEQEEQDDEQEEEEEEEEVVQDKKDGNYHAVA